MKCPACGTDANGAFCGRCGTRVDAAATCRRCGTVLPAGARFCVQCGAAARRGGAFGPATRLVLPIAAVVLLATAGAYWLGSRARDASRTSSGLALTPAAASARGAPPPLTGTPREQADRLFERVMQARARGDREEVEFFLPMALQAYRAVPDLDADGLFHLGLLQLESGALDDAHATAARIEGADAEHLFAAALVAEAAIAADDTAAARRAFAGFLARFDEQLARGLPEYEMHRVALDEYRAQARSLGGA